MTECGTEAWSVNCEPMNKNRIDGAGDQGERASNRDAFVTRSAAASVFGLKCLGYALWVATGREVQCAVAHKALDNFKARIRQLTRRSGGRSLAQVVEKLRSYMLGWKAYFGLVQTPRVWRELDEWLRHRLRAIQLRHWRRPHAIYRELKALGAKENVPRQVAGNSCLWWRNSAKLLNGVLTIRYFRTPTLMTSSSRTTRCGPACRVMWQGCLPLGGSLCRLRIRICGDMQGK